MLTIYHLTTSRSGRIIWLVEELGLQYEVQAFSRTPGTLPPAEYKALHPLGRSPIIKDGDLILAESGAIFEYLLGRYGNGELVPEQNSPEHVKYLYWLHFAEGSLMAHFLAIYALDLAGAKDHPMRQGMLENLARDLTYAETALAQQPYFAGPNFTACDVMMFLPLLATNQFKNELPPRPLVKKYLSLLAERPAYRTSLTFG
jgi:glutathione S-transferase